MCVGQEFIFLCSASLTMDVLQPLLITVLLLWSCRTIILFFCKKTIIQFFYTVNNHPNYTACRFSETYIIFTFDRYINQGMVKITTVKILLKLIMLKGHLLIHYCKHFHWIILFWRLLTQQNCYVFFLFLLLVSGNMQVKC